MTQKPQAVGIIPARWDSSRFPGKPLALLGGKPMVLWVMEAADRAASLDEVIVATDDSRIRDAVTQAGGKACMTSPEHETGSDRIAEVAAGGNWEIVVNIQGDEPLIDPFVIDRAVEGLKANPDIPVSTLKTPIKSKEEFNDPNAVKVVTDINDRALYFSRSSIPFDRDGNQGDKEKIKGSYRHLGLYAYRKNFLIEFTQMRSTILETKEKLEQLRILESGHSILVLEVSSISPGVDCPEDLARLETLIKDRE
ncbi:MAG: 3-deoxy-manno-octulosonate cytidylyltransferase [Candidatus Nitronauta litoralis]|uniref:3-deoxy-manno-octulosonate cytidylyltransferase n=1 Tax=Candidatus Nitronauta litoralis TaxID=2705533 RepID=A0A7T0BYU4_9BACT|nr:MAG: 3-deoxy-manno-octulosonate cytidylyltransferase [Candidatus Nitronauta litoralis]